MLFVSEAVANLPKWLMKLQPVGLQITHPDLFPNQIWFGDSCGLRLRIAVDNIHDYIQMSLQVNFGTFLTNFTNNLPGTDVWMGLPWSERKKYRQTVKLYSSRQEFGYNPWF